MQRRGRTWVRIGHDQALRANLSGPSPRRHPTKGATSERAATPVSATCWRGNRRPLVPNRAHRRRRGLMADVRQVSGLGPGTITVLERACTSEVPEGEGFTHPDGWLPSGNCSRSKMPLKFDMTKLVVRSILPQHSIVVRIIKEFR